MPVWQQWDGPTGELAIHEPTSGLAGPTKGVIVVSHGMPVEVGQPGVVPSGLVALSDRLAADSGSATPRATSRFGAGSTT
jgi:hypothetical protein